jgi:hypothetical protein
MNLLELFNNTQNKSDKELYHRYISNFYSDKFEKFKNKNISILEIGIQYGNSLKLWEQFFLNSQIYSIDINPYYIHEYNENVNIIIGDAYCEKTINYFKEINIKFDIIIDDGPHTLSSQDYFLENYQQFLKPKNSIIILEDIYDGPFSFLKEKYTDFTILDFTEKIQGERNSRIMFKENL